jgi:serine/threonine protein kinase
MRLARALDAYLAAVQAGTPPDKDEFLARYPELAEDLEICLASLEFIRRAAVKPSSPMPDSSTPPGDGLITGVLGDFRILSEVGRGGMGVVYEAEQVSLGRRVALKVLPFAAAMDPRQLQRFKNEAQAAAHLQHQHIVPVYGVGCERGVHYYAMQYIDGQTLAAVIRELRRNVERPITNDEGMTNDQCQRSMERVPQADAVTKVRDSTLGIPSSIGICHSSFFRTVAMLGVQAAEALEHAHQQGVIHRDIKPANLLIDGADKLWITDFGLARLQGDAGLTMSGDVLGTLRYMSPEQALGKGAVADPRTDVYSLGLTLYEVLTLAPAYPGGDRQEVLRQIAEDEPTPPRQWNQAIPAELETIVLKAMGKSADERYATAQDLAEDLRRFLEDKPIKAKWPTVRQRARKWARRHKALVAASFVFLALLLVFTAVGATVSAVLIWQEEGRTKGAFQAETRAREDLHINLYFKNIALAERESAVNNLGRMEQLLDQCPEDLRGWEWHYLQRLGRQRILPLRHEAVVMGVAYSPTGQWFASATLDGNVTIWDARSRQPLSTFQASETHALVLAFSPDGRRLTSNRRDGVIKVWEALTGRELLAWPAHGDRVTCVAFSPDGRRLLSAGADAGPGGRPGDLDVKIWDAASGRLLKTLPRLNQGLAG